MSNKELLIIMGWNECTRPSHIYDRYNNGFYVEKTQRLIDQIINESEKHPVLHVGCRCGRRRNGYYDRDNYISYITEEEVTSSIMRGVDILNRMFIVLKLLVDKKVVIQIFQETHGRYHWRSHSEIWCRIASGKMRRTIPPFRHIRIYKEGAEAILDLIKGKTVKLYLRDLPYSKKLDGNNVSLYDQEKHEAVQLIERNWLKCRYDPEYKMCERVQMHNLEDIYTEAGRTLN